jgi:hypothetical protein
MILSSRTDAPFLPLGDLMLIKEDLEFHVIVDESYSGNAAQFLIEKGTKENFNSQAEIIAYAINQYKWEIGAKGFHARASGWSDVFNRKAVHQSSIDYPSSEVAGL